MLGAPLLAARFPRAYLDVNREAWELDPTMFSDGLPNFVNIRSPRVRMGLGTIARVVASGEEIYARKLRFAEAKRRVETLYHPYHHALRRLVGETENAFGGYLLIDCHSMPSAASEAGGQVAADIVLGDCHGAACAAQVVDAARSLLTPARLLGRDERALCRRVYHRPLRQPASRPPRAADRDQSRPLHGRAQLPQEAGLRAAGGGDDRARRASRPTDAASASPNRRAPRPNSRPPSKSRAAGSCAAIEPPPRRS